MSTTEMDAWSEKFRDRKLLDDFLDWLQENGHTPPRFHSGREAALDSYFGVDRRQLEAGRRALLAQVQEQAKGLSL